MTKQEFARELGALLGRGKRPGAVSPAGSAAAAPAGDAQRERFARLLEERVLPLLQRAAAGLSQHGIRASARLYEADGRVVAELTAHPPGLPAGARAPVLIITAARKARLANAPSAHDRPLLVEFTGTFPRVGASGGFGAEVEYDTVTPGQVQEKVRAFVRLVTGA